MTASKYKREPTRFQGSGLVTVTPPDMMPPGRSRRLLNVRLDEELGAIKTRPGIQWINQTSPLPGPITAIRRINDNYGLMGLFIGDYYYVIVSNGEIRVGSTTMSTPLQDPNAIAGFGNRPASILTWRPNNSPRTWAYIYSADKMVKVGRDNQAPAVFKAFQTGIDPPQWEPTCTEDPTFSGGVDDIYYRYRYRSTMTGAKSSPCPEPVRVGSAGPGSGVSVAPRVMNDPQVDVIDVFRIGAAILDYRYVGSVNNIDAGGGFAAPLVDTITDLQLSEQSEILEEDLWRPFCTVQLPLEGTIDLLKNNPFVGVSKVTWVSSPDGRKFPTYLLPGTLITIQGVPYSVYGWNDDDDVIYIVGGPAGNLTGAPFVMSEPTTFGKPLPYSCGPFQGFGLATGDKYRPGALYWTNGNDFDSTSPVNYYEVTSPSEPLASPFMMGGKAFVFSSERLFNIYPAFDQVNQFTPIEAACQRGLLFNWAFCTDGERQGTRCWFLAKDGIYETQGAEATCITDELFNLFPHEGTDSNPTDSSSWLQPINFLDQNRLNLKLVYHEGNIYFSFTDMVGTAKTLVYSTRMKVWMSLDVYAYSSKTYPAYSGEGREIRELIYAADGGFIGRMDESICTDFGSTFSCAARSQSFDWGDPGARKQIGDITYEYKSPGSTIIIRGYLDNEAVQVGNDTAPISPGRTQRIVDINTLGRNVAIDFQWVPAAGTADTVLYMWMPSAIPKPEAEARRWHDWHEFIEGGADAYVTGIVLHCSTDDSGVAKTIQIWADNVYTGNQFTFTAAGEQKIELSWPVFKGKLARIVPTNTSAWRVFGWDWVAEKEPLLIGNWDSNWRPAIQGEETGYVTGLTIEADTVNANKAIMFQYELEGVVLNPVLRSVTANPAWNGRSHQTFSFEPFRAQILRFYSNDGVSGRLYDFKWWVSPEPPTLTNFNANWEDGGYLGAKFLQGIIIDADTNGETKLVDIEYEDGIICTFQVNHTKRQGKPYALPFARVVNKIRAIPRDANPSWLYKIEWKFQAHPESVWAYETQKTSHGMVGWWHQKDGFIAYESDCVVYLVCTLDDGSQYSIVLPSTLGDYRKVYVVFPATKQKLMSYKFTSFLWDITIPILYVATLD